MKGEGTGYGFEGSDASGVVVGVSAFPFVCAGCGCFLNLVSEGGETE